MKSKTTELHQNFRAKEISEADTKLKALKEEERRKLKETEELHRQFKKLEIGEDEKKLAELKQQERKRVQETEHMYHTYQNNTIKDSDMKLSLMRQEDRKRLQEHERTMRMVNHTPGFVQAAPAKELRRSSSHENLRSSIHDDWTVSIHTRGDDDENDEGKETIPIPEQSKQHTKPPGRFFRRSSISTDFSGNWRAANGKAKEVTAPSPILAPASPVSEPMETTGQTSLSSIQNARSVFSKGNSVPRPAYVRTNSSTSYSSMVENMETYGQASMSSLKSPDSRAHTAPRPLYARDDSDSSSMAADPLDLGNSRVQLQLDTPEPSERVDESNRSPSAEAKVSPMKAALSIFNKGSGGVRPPKTNSYASSKHTHAPVDAIKPEQVPPKESKRKTEKPLLVKALPDEIPREEEKTPEEIEGDALLSTTASVVRLDILFSFGLLTASNEPVFTNYMNAVETIVKRTLVNDAALAELVWYDPVYPPFVQEYKTDGKYCTVLLKSMISTCKQSLILVSPLQIGTTINLDVGMYAVYWSLPPFLFSSRMVFL